MNFNNKFDLYCWACDFSSKRGEGILARHYVQTLSKLNNKRIFVKSGQNEFSINKGEIKQLNNRFKNKEKLNLNFFENYLLPFIGIFYLWLNYLRGRGICYLNFLPLWNTFLFILLPPKTHFGPITGFIFKKKVTGLNSFFRKYINYLLFRVNIYLVYFRQNIIYFSTDLLKSIINKKHKKKIFYNYLVNLVKINRIKTKKDIDLLIYNRNYSVKNNFLRNKFLKNLLKMNYKIFVVGDNLNLKKFKNLGFIDRKKIIYFLKKSKFIINSGENPYNIFTIDAFNNHVNIIYEHSYKKKIKYFNKEKLIFINFEKIKKIKKLPLFKKNKNSRITKNLQKLTNDNKFYFKNVNINYTKIKFN